MRDQISKLLITGLFAGGCIDDTLEEPALAEVESAVLNNLEWRYEYSGEHSTWWRSPTARCSSGNVLYGMGAAVPTNPLVLFRGMLPEVPPSGFTPIGGIAAAQEGVETDQPWQMTAYAICGQKLDNQRAYKAQSGPGPQGGSSWSRNVTVRCPEGLKVVGAGGSIVGGERGVKVDEIRPSSFLDSVTVFASETREGTDENWAVTAHAICATPPPGLVRVTRTVASGWNSQEVIAWCPGNKRLVGTAGGVDAFPSTDLRVFNIVPSYDLRYAIVRARAVPYGAVTNPPGDVKAYAICADP